jgi:hypothetical protein
MLAFNAAVTINGIGTLFDSGRNLFGSCSGAPDCTNGAREFVGGNTDPGTSGNIVDRRNTFQYSTNVGATWNTLSFGTANGVGANSIVVNDDIWFRQNLAGIQPQFFVSALTYNVNTPGGTVSVPGPMVGAGLPGLLAACLGLGGLAYRRRRKQQGGLPELQERRGARWLPRQLMQTLQLALRLTDIRTHVKVADMDLRPRTAPSSRLMFGKCFRNTLIVDLKLNDPRL